MCAARLFREVVLCSVDRSDLGALGFCQLVLAPATIVAAALRRRGRLPPQRRRCRRSTHPAVINGIRRPVIGQAVRLGFSGLAGGRLEFFVSESLALRVLAPQAVCVLAEK